MMINSDTFLKQPHPPKHILIEYSDKKKCDKMLSEFFNEGLKLNQLCVYATVNDTKTLEDKLSLSVDNLNENILQKNFLIVDLKEFYVPLLQNDLAPFDRLKNKLDEMLRNRKDKHVRLVGDLVSFCFEKQHFDSCKTLETWWNEISFEGTAVCPYPISVLSEPKIDVHSKNIEELHNHVIYC